MDIKKIHEHAKKSVSVACDEYHQHSALQGCLHGDENAINVCKLCEYIYDLQEAVVELNKKIVEVHKKVVLDE